MATDDRSPATNRRQFVAVASVDEPLFWFTGAYEVLVLGPSTWQQVAPAATGLHQSPVNIKADDVIYDAELSKNPLRIQYDPSRCTTMINTGTSLQCNVDAQDTCELQYSSLFVVKCPLLPYSSSCLISPAVTCPLSSSVNAPDH